MSEGKNKGGIRPHLPYFCANGNKVVATWEEETTTRDNLRVRLVWVRYRDSKGKESEAIRQVIWIDIPFSSVR